MADIGSGKALLFGGNDGARDDATWVYDLSANTWTQKTTTTRPSARYGHAIAYLGNEWAILFCGNTVSNRFDDETWIAGGMGPTAVTLSSFRADAPSLDLWQWLTRFLGQ